MCLRCVSDVSQMCLRCVSVSQMQSVSDLSSIVISPYQIKCLKSQLYSHFTTYNECLRCQRYSHLTMYNKVSQMSALFSLHNVQQSVSEVSSSLISQCATKCLKSQLYCRFTMYNNVSQMSALFSFHNVKSSVSKCQPHTHSTMYNEKPLVLGLFGKVLHMSALSSFHNVKQKVILQCEIKRLTCHFTK